MKGAQKAIYEKGRIIVSGTGEELRQKGYGLKRKGRLVLRGYEAYHLAAKGTVEIYDNKGNRIHASELFEKVRELDEDLLVRYLIYQDLRDKGYVVSEGMGRGISFSISRGERGEYFVYGLYEGEPISLARLNRVLSSAEEKGLRPVLAIVNRQGEVVYYSLDRSLSP